MKLYEEDLRLAFIEITEKYAEPLCNARLSEDELVEVADSLRNSFLDAMVFVQLVRENKKLKKNKKSAIAFRVNNTGKQQGNGRKK